MRCIHWIHRHSRRGFISTYPANTGPKPVNPTAVKEKIDIGRPRLTEVPQTSMTHLSEYQLETCLTYSCGSQRSAILPAALMTSLSQQSRRRVSYSAYQNRSGPKDAAKKSSDKYCLDGMRPGKNMMMQSWQISKVM